LEQFARPFGNPFFGFPKGLASCYIYRDIESVGGSPQSIHKESEDFVFLDF
jgi:hypothetical protein